MCRVNLRLTLEDRVSRTSTPRPYFLRVRGGGGGEESKQFPAVIHTYTDDE